MQFLASFETWGDDSEQRYIAYDAAAVTWWRTARLADEPHLTPSPAASRSLHDLPDLSDPDLLAELAACSDRVGAAGMPVYLLDQTRPDVGLAVAKVVAPGLRHMWARLGPGRLYDVPVALGWLERPTPEEELNPCPVFF